MSGIARKAKASQIGYKRGRLSTTVPADPVTDAYRAGYDLIDWSARLPDKTTPKQSKDPHG